MASSACSSLFPRRNAESKEVTIRTMQSAYLFEIAIGSDDEMDGRNTSTGMESLMKKRS
ncbi:MAG TPA: hypothetical protein VII61_07000 [Ktedonobacteraceae bacterium]